MVNDKYILVDDALTALQQLAHMHRQHFHGPVIQITGTNGKTTTKELVSTVLAQKYNVLYTQGNLNNHIGVPMTLLRLTSDHDIAVIETGANHPGEIKALANIVDPDYGLITNVGVAHIEGFGSFEGVVKTKGELYDYLRSKKKGVRSKDANFKSTNIFLNADNPHLVKIAEGLDAFTYGRPSQQCDIEGEVLECAPFLTLRWKGKKVNGQWSMVNKIRTRLIGAYNIDNVLAAVSVGVYFGVEPNQICAAIEGYVPSNNRSELRTTDHNQLIVDAYNANPSSMKAALDNFALITPPEGMTKMLILGEMRELGDVSEQEHTNVIEHIKSIFNGQWSMVNGQWSMVNKDSVWLVGENFQRLNPPFRTFANVEEVKTQLKDAPIDSHLILIKGSNGTHLYELPEYL